MRQTAALWAKNLMGAAGSAPGAAALVLLLLCSSASRRALAVDILSSSKLEACVRNGSQVGCMPWRAAACRMCCVRSTLAPPPHHQGANASALSCRQKLVVTLTVDSGDALPNQEIAFSLSCIGRCRMHRAGGQQCRRSGTHAASPGASRMR